MDGKSTAREAQQVLISKYNNVIADLIQKLSKVDSVITKNISPE